MLPNMFNTLFSSGLPIPITLYLECAYDVSTIFVKISAPIKGPVYSVRWQVEPTEQQ